MAPPSGIEAEPGRNRFSARTSAESDIVETVPSGNERTVSLWAIE
jgi:hypothetical protein